MPRNFYKDPIYREKQSAIMKESWKKGLFKSLYRRESRMCDRRECGKRFEVMQSDHRIYCSQSCAAVVNNQKRRPPSQATRLKVSLALKGRKSPFKGIIKVPKVEIRCANLSCGKLFIAMQWARRKFCSNKCAMAVIGGKATSPKAARGKAGIRKDISKTIYFYSRWEANTARLFNYLGIKWVHQPKTFNLVSQNYTPDFYLPDYDIYIEVKNFLWKYSKIRDVKFRKIYPTVKLHLLLKEEYLELEKKYSPLVKNWEYKNSPFEN